MNERIDLFRQKLLDIEGMLETIQKNMSRVINDAVKHANVSIQKKLEKAFNENLRK